jgi:3-hydroxyisobutyrate dehydrogenase-like beta-hydroxyacid dehydrogenase
MMDTSLTIGFIGAGQLGEPTVERIIDAGLPVLLYARRPEVRTRLAERGAALVDSPAGVAGADIVVLYLFSDEQILEVALGAKGDNGVLAGMRRGASLVIHTTVSVQTLNQLATAATPLGVNVLDAPVSGTAEHIRAGKLTVLVGGAPTAVERCSTLFAAYADHIVTVGALGSAMKAKLVNNILFAANVQLVGAAAHLAEELGVAPMAALAALNACSSGSAAMGYVLASGDLEKFAVGIAHYLRKDVAACQVTASELAVDLGLLGEVARNGPLDLT